MKQRIFKPEHEMFRKSFRDYLKDKIIPFYDAWEEAVYDGIDPDCVATAAIFAALSDMIATYGEEPVAKMVERLPDRIRIGEFTVARTTQ